MALPLALILSMSWRRTVLASPTMPSSAEISCELARVDVDLDHIIGLGDVPGTRRHLREGGTDGQPTVRFLHDLVGAHPAKTRPTTPANSGWVIEMTPRPPHEVEATPIPRISANSRTSVEACESCAPPPTRITGDLAPCSSVIARSKA